MRFFIRKIQNKERENSRRIYGKERGLFMKKRKFLSILLTAGLCVSLGIPSTVFADSQKVVTLGADLTEDQKAAVLRYFGVLGQNIQTLTITNQDEREHLGSYVPLEQIGTRTFSCALVCPTNSGGIHVKTANLNWVTSNMIATTLSTSGVVNCDVLAASPFEVSGTGALTGIIMAYESASGTTLDPVKKELATQELITTGTIANDVGQTQATNIVNEIKIQVIEGQVVEPEEVEEIVEAVVDENPEVSLSQEDYDILVGLMTQIAEQQYDYEEMKDTLERVESNVSDINSKVDQLQTEATTGVAETPATEEPLSSESILMNTDDTALGADINIDATNQEAVQAEPVQPETTAPEDPFAITSTEVYTDEQVEYVDQGDASVDGYTEDAYNETPSDENAYTDDGLADSGMLPEGGEEVPAGDETSGTPEETAAALELGNYVLKPASDEKEDIYAAGASVYKLMLQNTDVVPVSGTLTVADEFGSVCCTIDLANSEQIQIAAMTAEELMEENWEAGSKVLINTGYQLQPYSNYTVALDGVVASSLDATMTAPVASVIQVSTNSFGIGLNIAKDADVYPGAVISGNLFMEGIAYAEITDYDAAMISPDVTQFTPDATAFQISCLQSGRTEFTADFYDADGNPVGSTTYELYIR